ncbi:O-acetyl-ADP-ribose deacetylase [Apibacter muscae]|uniref:O-acetyl-ADP-ribose deacetylase n=1 Tax=Apibacter muscae TaxID=2509004 RepID=A0A563DFR9_9FLAO|nr:O-acetyl-ADP-ribose deacetylase [Apibacter muscae]TWP29096.1 O-acetyl-ADP-ribose deacetylase [Apibacter muscae]TWP30323.1 O-acetyl-ADP-ribose deacetylase [Apibacter muscae]
MKIEVCSADITNIEVDGIVNAANTSLLGGSGVDGAIHRKGGIEILEECKKIRSRQGGCKVGEAVYTVAGNLPSNYVIHTVGPVWSGGINKEKELLSLCYTNSLKIANQLQLKSIAFPNISTGIYKFPKPLAAEIAISSVINFLEKENTSLIKVYFVCLDQENEQLYRDNLRGRIELTH